MLRFFKPKNQKIEVYSSNSGCLYALEQVKDDIFSTKMMGEGIAIKTDDAYVFSPISGTIEMIADTKHAVIVKNESVNILVHVGVDTCMYKGEGLQVLTTKNAEVKVGDPLIKVDRQFFKEKNINTDTILIFMDCESERIQFYSENLVTQGKTAIASICNKKQ